MTINQDISISTTKITGLTDNTTYFIQAFYKTLTGLYEPTVCELFISSSAPSDLKGLENSQFKITKKTDTDIYIKALKENCLVVVEEC